VTLRSNGGNVVRQIVTGDSYRSQHANTVHFGLGKADRVERVEIRWPGRPETTLLGPKPNRYHVIRATH